MDIEDLDNRSVIFNLRDNSKVNIGIYRRSVESNNSFNNRGSGNQDFSSSDILTASGSNNRRSSRAGNRDQTSSDDNYVGSVSRNRLSLDPTTRASESLRRIEQNNQPLELQKETQRKKKEIVQEVVRDIAAPDAGHWLGLNTEEINYIRRGLKLEAQLNKLTAQLNRANRISLYNRT